MITRLRVAIVAVVLILPVATAVANPSWAVALGVDVWNLPALHEQVASAADQERELDAVDAEVRGRIGVKEELINGLIAGRGTLAETAAKFTVLNDGYAEYLYSIRRFYPGATDEERMLWNVVDYVQQRLINLPAWQKLTVMARLHWELQSLSAEFAKADAN